MFEVVSQHFVYYSIINNLLHICGPQKVVMVPVRIWDSVKLSAWQQGGKVLHVLHRRHIVIVAVVHVHATFYVFNIIGRRRCLLVDYFILFSTVVVLPKIS